MREPTKYYASLSLIIILPPAVWCTTAEDEKEQVFLFYFCLGTRGVSEETMCSNQ